MRFSIKHTTISGSVRAFWLAALYLMCAPTMFGQNDLSDETNDLLILSDQLQIDKDAELSVFGDLIVEFNGHVVNNGDLNFNATDTYQEVLNYSSDSAFTGLGAYSFLGKKPHYLSGDYNSSFYTLTLNKSGINTALISEVPEIRILNSLILTRGVLDVEENLLRIENPDSNSLQIPNFIYVYSFVNGRMVRRVKDGSSYNFPISSSNILRSVRLTNHFPEARYMEVAFDDKGEVDLSAEFGIQYGISRFQELDETGVWEIFSDVKNPDGYMDLETYIVRHNDYPTYKDNMFGLMHTKDIEYKDQDWYIEGDMEYFNSPYRKAKTQTTKLRNVKSLGYYAVGIAERQKFVNLIAPGGGRETRFIIQGLDIENPTQSQYDNENCELTLYNLFGAEVWRKKPYQNDLDLRDFQDGTYYYEFKFTINGRPGSIQSYIDVKRMD